VVINQIEAHALNVVEGEVAISDVDEAGRLYSLVVSSGARLDLGRAALVVDYGAPPFVQSPLASLVAGLADGRIDTSASGRVVGYAEASELGVSSFLNQSSIDITAVLLRSTLPGDTNLDGSVQFNDLLALAQNYGNAGAWLQGDSDYDGTIGFADLLALAQNYGSTLLADGSTLAAFDADKLFALDWALALSVIPEPASLGLLAGASTLLLRRSR
jgi:hypothetical protein